MICRLAFARTARRIYAVLPFLLCIACSSPPIVGQLKTIDNQPFLLHAHGERLPLTPGLLSAEIGRKPETHGKLELKNNHGEIAIKTRPEHFQLNHFELPHREGELSSTIRGVWREETRQIYSTDELEHCTGYGFCLQSFPERICPSKQDQKRGKNCETIYVSRWVYAHNCPGRQPYHNTYQQYVTTLALEFLNPDKLTGQLTPQGSFEGSSQLQTRKVSSKELGPCVVP